jgi:hypothetical protein
VSHSEATLVLMRLHPGFGCVVLAESHACQSCARELCEHVYPAIWLGPFRCLTFFGWILPLYTSSPPPFMISSVPTWLLCCSAALPPSLPFSLRRRHRSARGHEARRWSLWGGRRQRQRPHVREAVHRGPFARHRRARARLTPGRPCRVPRVTGAQSRDVDEFAGPQGERLPAGPP